MSIIFHLCWVLSVRRGPHVFPLSCSAGLLFHLPCPSFLPLGLKCAGRLAVGRPTAQVFHCLGGCCLWVQLHGDAVVRPMDVVSVLEGGLSWVVGGRVSVTVATIYRDDVEVNAAKGGENLKLRLTGIDEEEMQPGFVICARHLPVPCVTHFGAQLQVR